MECTAVENRGLKVSSSVQAILAFSRGRGDVDGGLPCSGAVGLHCGIHTSWSGGQASTFVASTDPAVAATLCCPCSTLLLTTFDWLMVLLLLPAHVAQQRRPPRAAEQLWPALQLKAMQAAGLQDEAGWHLTLLPSCRRPTDTRVVLRQVQAACPQTGAMRAPAKPGSRFEPLHAACLSLQASHSQAWSLCCGSS